MRNFASQKSEDMHSGRSAVRLAHLLWEQGVEGSNPFTPTKQLKPLKISTLLTIFNGFFLSKKTVHGHKDLIFCTYVGAFCAILHPNACKILASNPVTFAR